MSINSTFDFQAIFIGNNINVNPINISYHPKGYATNTATKFRYLDLKKRPTIKNIDRLQKLYLLDNNWDGYGAEKIDTSLIKFCVKVISLLDDDKQPLVNPTGRNSIQMEYEKEDGTYFELEFFKEDVINLFRIDNAGNESFKTLVSIKEVLDSINSYFN
ncbi:hypothetical protein LLG10_08635 [bacterium]|nr:hypothetical protein [bacterium]